MPWVKRTKGWDSGGVAFPRELWAWSWSFLLLAEIPQSRVHTRCLGRRENKVWWGLTLCPLLLQWLLVPCVGELYLNQVWPVETHTPPSPTPPADQEPELLHSSPVPPPSLPPISSAYQSMAIFLPTPARNFNDHYWDLCAGFKGNADLAVAQGVCSTQPANRTRHRLVLAATCVPEVNGGSGCRYKPAQSTGCSR